jgi:hypothetical protein
MGGYFQSAGKSTAVDTAYAKAGYMGEDAEATPGKATQVGGEPAERGALANAFTNHFSSKTDPDFKLTDKERARSEMMFVGEVDRAKSTCDLAIGQVYTTYQAELREQRAEPGPLGALLVGVIGIAAEMALKSYTPAIAVKALMSIGITKHPPEIPEKALEFLAAPVDVGKDAIKPIAAGASDDKGTGFLDGISDHMSARFQQVAASSNTMSDDHLVHAIAAYDSKFHSLERYRELIEGLLKKFLGSNASKIGRGQNVSPDENLERRVAKIKPSGRLVYVGQRFDANETRAIEHRGAYNGASKLSLGDDTTPDEQGPGKGLKHATAATGVYFMGFVEDDMIPAALAAHEQQFQAEPEEYDWSMVAGYPKNEKEASE